AGHRDLLRVDDDDEVTGVDVWCVLRLALAAKPVGDLCRETPEGLPVGVDDVPLASDLARFGAESLHHKNGRLTSAGSRWYQLRGRLGTPQSPILIPMKPDITIRTLTDRGQRAHDVATWIAEFL